LGFNGDLYPTAGATSVMTSTGDIVRYNSERERYAIGATGTVLTVVGGLPAWATASGGLTQNTQTDHLTSDFTTTSTTLVTTGLALTLSNETDGNAEITVGGAWRNQDVATDVYGAITDDGTVIPNSTRTVQGGSNNITISIASTTFMATDGSDIDWRIRVNGGGTAFMAGHISNYTCAMVIKELY
jgi:hypothetical protein